MKRITSFKDIIVHILSKKEEEDNCAYTYICININFNTFFMNQCMHLLGLIKETISINIQKFGFSPCKIKSHIFFVEKDLSIYRRNERSRDKTK